MARTNGGLVGKRNVTSFGKCKVTDITSTGNHTTQSGTRLVQTAIISGGGGGGKDRAAGGGGGGLRCTEIFVAGCTAYPVVIGAAGAGVGLASKIIDSSPLDHVFFLKVSCRGHCIFCK